MSVTQDGPFPAESASGTDDVIFPAESAGGTVATASFGGFVARAQAAGQLVVQPRMGVSNPAQMRAGLLATRRATATTIGTITLDSYTRVGDDARARAALAAGLDLNGYPIVAHDRATTRAVLEGVAGPSFPVQIRHGSPGPENIFAALIEVGLDATEGGPVSYCLPYSRAPLAASVRSWTRSCERLARVGPQAHLETFGGAMMGQLCPPSLLVAMSVLECLFFRQHGIRSVSLSYAQQTNPDQDREAVAALHRLADQYLSDVDRHVVIYAYMGVFPRTPAGAGALLAEAARLAVRTGAARLIVKTAAEAHRIPTIAENVAALESAAAVADDERRQPVLDEVDDTGIHAEAAAFIDAVLELGPDLGHSLITAFRRGYLDVPYCLHPDNAGRARSYLDRTGRLQWSRLGSLPIRSLVRPAAASELTAAGLLESLSYVERKFDDAGLDEYLTGPAQPIGARSDS